MTSITLAAFASLIFSAVFALPTAGAPQGSAGHYPPCQLGLIEDRCNQLEEPSDRQGAARMAATAPAPSPNLAGAAGSSPANPIGSSPNDPVDTQRPGLITKNARGIDADAKGAPRSVDPDRR